MGRPFHYIDGFTIWGVFHVLNEHTFDLESHRDPISFHFTEPEANQAMAELNEQGHKFDYLYVEPDRQLDP